MKTLLFLVAMVVSLGASGQDAQVGKELYQANNCAQCHGVEGLGLQEEEAPRIAGQYDWYILKALTDFKSKTRVNEKMYPFIQNLSEADFKNLAAYVSTMKPEQAE